MKALAKGRERREERETEEREEKRGKERRGEERSGAESTAQHSTRTARYAVQRNTMHAHTLSPLSHTHERSSSRDEREREGGIYRQKDRGIEG